MESKRDEVRLLLLTQLQREVWRLFDAERLSLPEIESALKLSHGTAVYNLCRARRIMTQLPEGKSLPRRNKKKHGRPDWKDLLGDKAQPNYYTEVRQRGESALARLG
jgi:hypothetical protein